VDAAIDQVLRHFRSHGLPLYRRLGFQEAYLRQVFEPPPGP
jgi:hypothetical protein